MVLEQQAADGVWQVLSLVASSLLHWNGITVS